jgi:hypothetical protein
MSDTSKNDTVIDCIFKEQENDENIQKVKKCPKMTNKNIKRIKKYMKYNHSFEKFNVSITVIVEIYRLVIGICLIISVPQECNTGSCSISELVFNGNQMYDNCFYFNITTLFIFINLYIIELIREDIFIKYLDINNNLPTDEESVVKIINTLECSTKKSIHYIDSIYIYISKIAISFFVINTIFSAIIIMNNNNNNTNRTSTGFITNILFITTKLYKIQYILNTDKHVFYSAYLTNFVQYNDILKPNIDSSDSSDSSDSFQVSSLKNINESNDSMCLSISMSIPMSDLETDDHRIENNKINTINDDIENFIGNNIEYSNKNKWDDIE